MGLDPLRHFADDIHVFVQRVGVLRRHPARNFYVLVEEAVVYLPRHLADVVSGFIELIVVVAVIAHRRLVSPTFWSIGIDWVQHRKIVDNTHVLVKVAVI